MDITPTGPEKVRFFYALLVPSSERFLVFGQFVHLQQERFTFFIECSYLMVKLSYFLEQRSYFLGQQLLLQIATFLFLVGTFLILGEAFLHFGEVFLLFRGTLLLQIESSFFGCDGLGKRGKMGMELGRLGLAKPEKRKFDPLRGRVSTGYRF